MTGGARPEDRVPMIVGLHPMGGDPADLLEHDLSDQEVHELLQAIGQAADSFASAP
jgi:hypothetical protein